MFEVGDRVWSISYGWGKVVSVKECEQGSLHPVKARFETGVTAYYTLEGKYVDYAFRDLFFEEIPIPNSALERPRKTAEEMLDECEEVKFEHNKNNYYIYKMTSSGEVCEGHDTVTMVYGIKYISKEDAERIEKECKENN